MKRHLSGALSGGATVEEASQICEISGMQTIGYDVRGGWEWRGEVANMVGA